MHISCFQAYIFDHVLMACSTYELLGLVFLFKEWVPCFSLILYLMQNASENPEPLKRMLWNQFDGGAKKGILGRLVGRFGIVGIEGNGCKESLGMFGRMGIVGICGCGNEGMVGICGCGNVGMVVEAMAGLDVIS
ncbi:hypothetical protein LXL04_007100 [Taraxacum kok-saghyz]